MNGPYSDHLLDAADVCRNCLLLNRQERVSPIRKDDRTRNSGKWTTAYERIPRRTSVDYAEVGDDVTHAKGVWCRCGVEGSHHRIWNGEDLSRDRFKDLLKNALRTLEEKGVTLRRQKTAAHAIHTFDTERVTDDEADDADPFDTALAEAIDAGIVAAAASDGSDDRLRADGGTDCDP